MPDSPQPFTAFEITRKENIEARLLDGSAPFPELCKKAQHNGYYPNNCCYDTHVILSRYTNGRLPLVCYCPMGLQEIVVPYDTGDGRRFLSIVTRSPLVDPWYLQKVNNIIAEINHREWLKQQSQLGLAEDQRPIHSIYKETCFMWKSVPDIKRAVENLPDILHNSGMPDSDLKEMQLKIVEMLYVYYQQQLFQQDIITNHMMDVPMGFSPFGAVKASYEPMPFSEGSLIRYFAKHTLHGRRLAPYAFIFIKDALETEAAKELFDYLALPDDGKEYPELHRLISKHLIALFTEKEEEDRLRLSQHTRKDMVVDTQLRGMGELVERLVNSPPSK